MEWSHEKSSEVPLQLLQPWRSGLTILLSSIQLHNAKSSRVLLITRLLQDSSRVHLATWPILASCRVLWPTNSWRHHHHMNLEMIWKPGLTMQQPTTQCQEQQGTPHHQCISVIQVMRFLSFCYNQRTDAARSLDRSLTLSGTQRHSTKHKQRYECIVTGCGEVKVHTIFVSILFTITNVWKFPTVQYVCVCMYILSHVCIY